jgi:hypothetical protein
MSHWNYPCCAGGRNQYIHHYTCIYIYIYIRVMSPIHLYTSHVSYTFTHESCLLYTHMGVPATIHLHMSHVFHTPTHESCLSYIYIWVMSPEWFEPSGIIFCKCESASHLWFDPSVSSLRNLKWSWLIAMPSMREPNLIKCFWVIPAHHSRGRPGKG